MGYSHFFAVFSLQEALVLPEKSVPLEEAKQEEEEDIQTAQIKSPDNTQEHIAEMREAEAEKENEMLVSQETIVNEEQAQEPQQPASRKRPPAVLTPPPAIKGPPLPTGVFDVPLELPPSPPRPAEGGEVNRNPPGRVYVCPICGDNALSTLRERDRHLVSEHSGELVFPCQVLLCRCQYLFNALWLSLLAIFSPLFSFVEWRIQYILHFVDTLFSSTRPTLMPCSMVSQM